MPHHRFQRFDYNVDFVPNNKNFRPDHTESINFVDKIKLMFAN